MFSQKRGQLLLSTHDDDVFHTGHYSLDMHNARDRLTASKVGSDVICVRALNPTGKLLLCPRGLATEGE